MKIELVGINILRITRETNDPKFYGVQNAAGESNFLYFLKKELNKRFPTAHFIKKRMAKDGHLVDDMQQYIRTKDGNIMIYNGHWQIEGIEVDWNKGCARLLVDGDENTIRETFKEIKYKGNSLEVIYG